MRGGGGDKRAARKYTQNSRGGYQSKDKMCYEYLKNIENFDIKQDESQVTCGRTP